MNFYITIIDNRHSHIASYLIEKGMEISTVEEADFLVLPISRVEEYFSLDEENINRIKKGATVFTGIKNEKLTQLLENRDVELCEIMNYEEIAIYNSVPTAEGVIYSMIKESSKTISGSKVLILGYGICGSAIGDRIKALGGDVYIYSLNNIKSAYGKIKGLKRIDSLDNLGEYDVIINTIPSHILSENQIKELCDAIVLDIASIPYGFDQSTMDKHKVNYHILKALPSKYGTATSGERIGEFIYNRMVN